MRTRDDRHGLDVSDLAAEIRRPVAEFHDTLEGWVPDEVAVALAVAFGERLLAEMLGEAFGPARDTAPREEGR